MSDTTPVVEVTVIETPEPEPVVIVESEPEADEVDAVVLEAVIENASEVAELRAIVERQEAELAELHASQVVTETVAEIALDTAVAVAEEVHSEPEVVEVESPEPVEADEETEPKSKGHPFFKSWGEIRGNR